MRYFYGVYLKNTALSTVLDIIRFLGEPDSIRFAHITLRGPYPSGLNKLHLQALNNVYQNHMIKIVQPANFFSENQSTVVLTVNLLELNRIIYKPDFPNGVPHITLYDGINQELAKGVYSIVQKYDWQGTLEVGPLREIAPKKIIDEEFIPFFISFYEYFEALIGNPKLISEVRKLSNGERLDMIKTLLKNYNDKQAKRSRRDESWQLRNLKLLSSLPLFHASKQA